MFALVSGDVLVGLAKDASDLVTAKVADCPLFLDFDQVILGFLRDLPRTLEWKRDEWAVNFDDLPSWEVWEDALVDAHVAYLRDPWDDSVRVPFSDEVLPDVARVLVRDWDIAGKVRETVILACEIFAADGPAEEYLDRLHG